MIPISAVGWPCPARDIRGFSHLLHSSGTKSLEEVCLQVTDLLPGLKKLRSLLPEHGCLLLSPGNFWQNDWERFHADPDIIGTIHQHEPKTLQTSATLKGALSPQGLERACVWSRSPSVGREGVLGSPASSPPRDSPAVSALPVSPTDLLFGVPGKYSGVSLYTRKRMVSYTITLVFQRYHAK